ncbi:NAD(+) synthase [Parvularcula bermudensis HTCC2503]|uniref:Glutamine-dependent NAD(+) synthetase n=1 Tax=Parvularcula bermudensis (strain ATCC BAA-594 / HTCC2503 / KCTC 12087) TaxID=314260 RepID=E0TBH2_PARBH|nr:NAD+ synthase [Parvularcula bermudensis]ADM08347.1 NAD(+) synthase [Parvularcula bermudensis HTCC2503]
MTTGRLSIALAVLNPTVGDVAGNIERIKAAHKEATDCDLVVCSELCVSGYPPEDLVLHAPYAIRCREAVDALAQVTADGPALVVGTPWPAEGRQRKPYNASVLLADGKVQTVAYKRYLPEYGVFDEPRTFSASTAIPDLGIVAGVRLGLMTCEDMWYPTPAADLAERGAEIFVAPHGSPFRLTAHAERLFHAKARVRETGRPLVFTNQVGGQDELVFDGGAFAVDRDEGVYRGPLFARGITRTVWRRDEAGHLRFETGPSEDWPVEEPLIYPALVTGTRDYVRKSGFSSVVLGLSGGIDSAMVAAIAVDALGPDNVRCVMLPSRYTSTESLDDAAACAKALGVTLDRVEIEPMIAVFTDSLAPLFAGRSADVTEENLQSRIRGTALMALSNKFGCLLLSTGNKSEMATGYATLYGDMNGAYNPLKDVYKSVVFRLARWRNANHPSGGLGPRGEVIPERIITKPPSAELRADQRDDQSLPAYDILDDILSGLVEEDLSPKAVAARGHDPALVTKVRRLLLLSEYKRRQAPPGPKITVRNFGRDRRYPLLNRWGANE